MPPPDLFTVSEAAVVLRIGRTTAYDLARRDLATSGGEGLEVRRIGGQLRIPRSALERLAGGPISWPDGTAPEVGATAERSKVVGLVPPASTVTAVPS